MQRLVLTLVLLLAAPFAAFAQDTSCPPNGERDVGSGYKLQVTASCEDVDDRRAVGRLKDPDGKEVQAIEFHNLVQGANLSLSDLTGGKLADIVVPLNDGGYNPAFDLWAYDSRSGRYRRVLNDAGGHLSKDKGGLIVLSGLSGLVSHFTSLYRWNAKDFRMEHVAAISASPGETPDICKVTYRKDPVTGSSRPPESVVRSACAPLGKRYRVVWTENPQALQSAPAP